MEQFTEMINALDSWLWGLPMIVLLLGTHVFMTLRTGFIQRKTFTGIRLSVTKDPDSPGDVSQFQALTTALASTIGTGNIVGVGTAVFMGGPGAVLWCWLTGVFGIATKYAESLIAVKYRVKTADGRMEVCVRDTGSGFADGKKAAIDAMLASYDKQPPKLTGNSIGILNVQKRIKLLCGREYGLSYTENETGGVTAHIVLPLKEEGE